MSDAPRPTVARIRTHAKVNLFLRVLGPRPDGYHEVETILHGIELADELEFRVTSGRIDVEMIVSDRLAGIPPQEQNLVWLAANRLRERSGGRWGASVKITKGIPMGAGLGGGSGNAAGTLVVLNELWDARLVADDVLGAARALGSDVPYCLDGGTALATSRGETLTPLVCTPELWCVLALFERPLLTKDVYAAWTPAEGAPASSASMVMALGGGDVGEVAHLLHNDLEPPAFRLRPELSDAKQALLEAGALGAAMSGSGPTLFGIANDRSHAEAVADRVAGRFHKVVVSRSYAPCIERL